MRLSHIICPPVFISLIGLLLFDKICHKLHEFYELKKGRKQAAAVFCPGKYDFTGRQEEIVRIGCE